MKNRRKLITTIEKLLILIVAVTILAGIVITIRDKNKKNAILNVIKSLMSIIFPLITYPYVTRILGVENLGKINYTNSIVSYFALIASLGITTYAIREGAKIRNDREKIEEFSSEIFSINIITTIVANLLQHLHQVHQLQLKQVLFILLNHLLRHLKV